MQANIVNNFVYSQPAFGINLQSKKLNFQKKDFFVQISGYGTNSEWAKEVKNTADSAVNFMREDLDFESILRYITDGIKRANRFTRELKKRLYTGVLRTKRKDWHSYDEHEILITPYGKNNSMYKGYKDRFDRTVLYPLKNPYTNLSLTRPQHDFHLGKILSHPDSIYINDSLDLVRDLYKGIHKKYIEKEVVESDLPDINNTIAEIRWILAHATPWKRGSDAISNTFIRSIYKAIGIKTYPLKRGVSLDLEAYCTNLDEYKKNFSSYFSKKPKIID